VATVPQIFDLFANPQEYYDIFMNNYTERTWLAPVMKQELQKVMKTFAQYPPCKLRSDGFAGPVENRSIECIGGNE